MKPRQEWVPVKVEPIVPEGLFLAVKEKLESRSPDRVPPRVVNCPTLLTGLLKCGVCGSGMTLATGKGGKYRYYKCSSRILKGKDTCTSENLPTELVDRLVLTSLADRVFTSSRVQAMLEGLRKRLRRSQTDQEGKLKQLTKEVESLQHRSNQLYEAVEKGLLPMDETLTTRANKIQAQRQALLVEIAGLRRLKQMPLDALGEKKVQAFTTVLRERLIEKDRTFSKNYLKLLVDEIRYLDKQLVMKGSYTALARMVGESKKGTPQNGVPSFGLGWLPVCNPLHNRSLSPAVNQKPSISTCYQRSGRSRRTGSGIKSHFRSWCHQGTALPVVELSQFMPQNGDGHECRIPFVIQNLGSRRFPMSTVRRSPDIRWKTRNRVRSYLG